MCGRYAFDDIEDIFEARTLLEEAAAALGSEKASTVKTGEVFPSDTALVEAQGIGASVFKWGYPLHGTSRIIINARSETVFEKPMFSKSIAGQRCLVPCTGFFEWKQTQSGKQKYRINPSGERFFYLAGLFSRFNVDGSPSERFVIITAPANESMEEIHNRQPLIVVKDAKEEWLGSRKIDIEAIYKSIRRFDKIAV